MCELLGMSANVPTDICFSFTGLVQRGGGTGPHKDGWGITFTKERAVARLKIRNRATIRRLRNWYRITRSSPARLSPISVRLIAVKWRWKIHTLYPGIMGTQLDLCS